MLKSIAVELMKPFDYLTIGVVTRDLTPDGWTIGGTVSFSGQTAVALGCRTAIVTRATADFDFEAGRPPSTALQ